MQIKDSLMLALKAKQSNVEIHRHSACQIVFTEDNPFNTTIENTTYNEIFGFVIKPQVAHSCSCSLSNLIVLNIEPYSFLGKFISTRLGNSNATFLYDSNDFLNFFNSSNKDLSFLGLISTINQHQNNQPVDDRIQQAIQFIVEHFSSESISVKDIAGHVHLSPSRMSALFKKQIGSSFSKYLLWTRLRNAIFLLLSNKRKSITEIALESGFYDASQLNKYMYQMFGISPSRLKQKSDLIQFLELGPG